MNEWMSGNDRSASVADDRECDDNADNNIGLIITSVSRLVFVTLRIWRPQLTHAHTHDMPQHVNNGPVKSFIKWQVNYI